MELTVPNFFKTILPSSVIMLSHTKTAVLTTSSTTPMPR